MAITFDGRLVSAQRWDRINVWLQNHGLAWQIGVARSTGSNLGTGTHESMV